jgi:hypothetical protein
MVLLECKPTPWWVFFFSSFFAISATFFAALIWPIKLVLFIIIFSISFFCYQRIYQPPFTVSSENFLPLYTSKTMLILKNTQTKKTHLLFRWQYSEEIWRAYQVWVRTFRI